MGQINSQYNVTLIDGDGNEIKKFNIPEGVTSIGDNAFSLCSGLTSVTIPEGVTSIGSGAFYHCSGLTSVTIPEGVTSIGEGAFSGCTGLTSVTIPSSVTGIGGGAFNTTGLYENAPEGVFYVDNWVCGYKGKEPEGVLSLNPETHGIADGVFYQCYKLRGVTIPEGVKRIGARAFSCCDNITSITIPSSVKSIGSEAFFDCHLTEVLSYIEDPFDIDDSVFRQYGGPKYSDIFFTSATLYVPAGTKEKYLATPAWNQFQNIVEIKNIQFADATVKAICVENWDTNGDGELSYDEAAAVIDLGEVFINNSEITNFDELQYFTGLTSIGERAFYGCTNLTSVAIPSSVTSVGNYAFQDCSGLTKVIVTDIAAWCGISFGFFEEVSNPLYYAHHLYCDENTEITNLVIPQSVSSINKYAFYGCSGLTSVEIPSSVLSIGNQAFFCCSGLTSMTVDKGNGVYDSRNDCNAIIETASNELILGCQNTVIPSSVTSIGDNAFSCCIGLTSVTIPSSVTGIGERAFQNCTDLTSVIIPQRVTSIAYNAFDGCENASFKVCVTDKAAFCNNQIVGILSGMGKTFALIDGDGIEITEFNIPEGVKSIGEYAFTGCSCLTSVTIPSNVKSIGEYAFANCSGLTSVTISEGVKSIGSGAFSTCYNLTNVTIPSSVSSIGEDAFYGCSRLAKVIVPDIAAWCGISFGDSNANPLYFVKHIYSDENTEITDLVIPSGVASIGDYAFCNCSGLTSVTIPSSVKSIGSYAFGGCYGLTSITVDDGNGFYDSRNNCNAIIETATNTLILGCLNTVIPENVTGIGDYVFSGRTDLMSVSIPEGVTSIGNYAFSGCSNLQSINLPPNLEFIGRCAFDGCANIMDFNIPNTVTHIGGSAFGGTGITTLTIPKSVIEIEPNGSYGYSPAVECTKLESIFVEEGNPAFVSENGVLFNKDRTILMCYPAGKSDEKYIMPNTVTIVGASAFSGNKHLITVTLSSNLEIIGSSAFIWCSGLRDIYCYIIPDESFYDLGFGNGTNIFLLSTDLWENPIVLTLHVPVGCKQYYERWSLWNGMNIVEMENTNIEFADANVKAICVANWDTNGDGELSYDEAAAVTTIELTSLFIQTEITSFDELQYFTGLTRIGSQAFDGCTQLKSITIPSSVTNIGNYAFDGCTSLTSVTIPEGVNSIGEYAFRSCSSLANVTIQEGVQSIKDFAFFGCTSLTSMIIPKSVTSIGWNPFADCDKLSSLKVEEGNPVFDSREDCNAIIKTEDNKTISGCTNTNIPNTVTTIGRYSFYGSGLTSISIPHSVTTIEIYSFISNFYLTSITIPNSVTSIFESHGYASMGFSGCDNLTSIIVEEGNPVYDSRNNCNAIIKTADNELIAGCAKTIIPDMVTSIGVGAFSGCRFMSSIEIPKSVTTIDLYAFSFCWGLTSVTIPSSVTSIGWGAFYNCPSLTSVTSLIEEPFEIDSYTFENWNYETLESEFTSATLYVPAGTKEKYEATPAWNQFQNIVELGLEPVEQGETIDYASDINADTDLDGNVVGDIYYSISGGNGAYNAAEGCIVVTSPTDDDTVSGLSGTDIFGEDFNDHFTGIVFKVAKGKGTIKIEAQTTGTMVLKVKIGDNDPIEMELEGRLKVSFPYNVTEDTYVYIYGGESAAQANSMRRAAADSALKIYGIEVVKGAVDGIGTVMTESSDDAPVYNLSGQRVKTPHRGVYIQNGKKVLVK